MPFAFASSPVTLQMYKAADGMICVMTGMVVADVDIESNLRMIESTMRGGCQEGMSNEKCRGVVTHNCGLAP